MYMRKYLTQYIHVHVPVKYSKLAYCKKLYSEIPQRYEFDVIV